ncbi:voltage-dependent anion channel [Aspergillus tamarii]|uniref:Sulfite efflux pump SSU1 n=1 Tax=Aspergillus tamarii TaxID=41984 RepID=A0A5N6UQH7_ASPTM|nr:voltage-dependent anion channel [Aspergillus tamarii]
MNDNIKGGCGQASGHATTATRPPTSSFARALWNFSSQWFLIPQGTGIIAVILHQLDYQFRGLPIISVIVWVYTIVLLVIGVFLYMLRILLYRRHVAHVLRTSIIETSCLASIPITLTTIIQMTVLVLVRQWGAAWGIVAYVLWWINTAMAVVVVMGIPYVFVKIQPPGVKAVLPGVLLPLISALTSAAGGGVICRYGALGSRLQVPVIIVSYLEVGLGLTLAITLTDIFVTRLFDQSFPAVEEIYQDMILCGPFGQASFALQILGQAVLRDAFADYDRGTFLTAEAAKPIGFASELAGLLVWGYGTFWWCFAILSISHALISRARHRQQTSYTLAAWSLVFPWGVYTNAAVELGKLMDSPAFKVWSTALLITLLVIWIVNHYFTVKGLVTGDLLGLRSRPGS